MLPNGAMIIDTPGMRELGMWDADEGIDKTFQDVDKYIGECKYSDCTHTNEPGCKILDAIQSGELSEERYEQYIKLEKANAEDKKELLEWFSTTNNNGEEKITRVKTIFEKTQATQATQEQIQKYTNVALNILEDLKIDETHKIELKTFALNLMNRLV